MTKKTLTEIIDSYYDPISEVYLDEAKILAVKYIMNTGREEALEYFDMDDVLGWINRKNNFKEEPENYEKYVDYSLFGMKKPNNIKEYLKNPIPRRMLDRICAAKIIDESDFLDFEFFDRKIIYGDDEIYEIAQKNLESKISLSREDAITEAIYSVITAYSDKAKLKILGEDGYLDLKLLEKNIPNGNFSDVLSELNDLYKPKTKERAEVIMERIRLEGDNYGMYDLISEKIRKNYFPNSGIDILRLKWENLPNED